ncbi:MAG: hypothetical protein AABY26_02065, partial [Nanoarchaeota archaeon]
ISGALRRNFGVYLLAGGLMVGGAYGCGRDKEEKRVSCTPTGGGYSCGEYGSRVCSKPESASNDECECDCHYPWDSDTPEPSTGCMNGMCCQTGLCYMKSDFEGVDEVK